MIRSFFFAAFVLSLNISCATISYAQSAEWQAADYLKARLISTDVQAGPDGALSGALAVGLPHGGTQLRGRILGDGLVCEQAGQQLPEEGAPGFGIGLSCHDAASKIGISKGAVGVAELFQYTEILGVVCDGNEVVRCSLLDFFASCRELYFLTLGVAIRFVPCLVNTNGKCVE